MDNFQIAEQTVEPISVTSVEIIWSRCLQIVRDNIKPLPYKTWFEPIKPVSLENMVLTVQVPSTFFYEWIEEHYFSLITSTLQKIVGTGATLRYTVVSAEETLKEALLRENLSAKQNGNHASSQPSFALPTFLDRNPEELPFFEDPKYQVTNLNPKYTFDNFIQGDGNQFARAAGLNVANNSGHTSFNPLVLYGGVGLGKTHLIQAIGNAVMEKNRNTKILYMSSEKFTIDFVEAIEKNKTKEFSDFFRSMDVLIIDDIQFFSGKERTQDNFFHTFNTLHQLKKQIILSSDRAPKDITGLSERLISRFQWGLTVDIQPPDLETRIAILRVKSEQDNISLPQDVLEFIAANVKSNIRELEGCYITLLARHTLDRRPIDVTLAEEVLRSVTSSVQKQLTVEQIQKIVSEHYKLSENLLRAKTRKQEIVLARQVAMFLSKTYTSATLKTIGLHFGGRDHSTVIHACQTITSLVAEDQSVANSVHALEKQISVLAP